MGSGRSRSGDQFPCLERVTLRRKAFPDSYRSFREAVPSAFLRAEVDLPNALPSCWRVGSHGSSRSQPVLAHEHVERRPSL